MWVFVKPLSLSPESAGLWPLPAEPTTAASSPNHSASNSSSQTEALPVRSARTTKGARAPTEPTRIHACVRARAGVWRVCARTRLCGGGRALRPQAGLSSERGILTCPLRGAGRRSAVVAGSRDAPLGSRGYRSGQRPRRCLTPTGPPELQPPPREGCAGRKTPRRQPRSPFSLSVHLSSQVRE